jgi:DNA-binding MarR family transcriptional regulator
MVDNGSHEREGSRGSQPHEKTENESVDLGLEVPERSFLTGEEYLEMYRTACSQPAFTILYALSERERLSSSDLESLLDREGNELHYHLRKLKQHGLVRNRRDPNTGTEETYSYYTLTDLGKTVLSEGPKAGIEKHAAEEMALTKEYSD